MTPGTIRSCTNMPSEVGLGLDRSRVRIRWRTQMAGTATPRYTYMIHWRADKTTGIRLTCRMTGFAGRSIGHQVGRVMIIRFR